jgi:serine/threonine protein kinase
MRFQRGDFIGNKYKVIKKIGSGSFGVIYLGKSTQLFQFESRHKPAVQNSVIIFLFW